MQGDKSWILTVILVFLVIFVVAALLFPVLLKATDHARPNNCQSNLKQCAQALKMYSDDYNGQMPSSFLVSRSKYWSRRDAATFVSKLGSPYPPPAGGKRTWSQVLYDNMRNKDIMFCPSDETDHTAAPNVRTSYWYKLAMDRAWYGVGCDAPRRSMGDYAYESDQIAFYERMGWHFNDTKGLHNGVRINASFVDTHVETIVVPNATSGDPINCAANTDGEPMYYNLYNDPTTGETRCDTGPAKHTDPTIYSDKL